MIFLEALKWFGVSILVLCIAFTVLLTLYMVKQIRWERHLEGYKPINVRGHVINKQGFVLETAEDLLKELQGIEESIVKDEYK